MWKEFKKFAVQGSVIDLAVGVIIGGAFGKVASSLVDDIVMPTFGILLGGLNLSNLSYRFRDSVIYYGVFMQTILDFFIVSLSIFFFVKILMRIKSDEAKRKAQASTKQEELLTEIRDLLQTQSTPKINWSQKKKSS